MKNKHYKIIISACLTVFIIFFVAGKAFAQLNFKKFLSGKILLQVQSRGEAWYVNPADSKRYFLGRPADALNLMQRLGTGISDENLVKIPVGLLDNQEKDSDGDGLSDELEKALGTNPQKKDTDRDGYDDKTEIIKNYNPVAAGPQTINLNFARLNSGKIFLQVNRSGQAWYVYPNNLKRYFLGGPADALRAMQKLGLGITDQNLTDIEIGSLADSAPKPSLPPPPIPAASSEPISAAATAIRSGNVNLALIYFTSEAQTAVKYTLNYLNDEGRLTLGNILSGSSLTDSSAAEKIYSNEIFFSLGNEKIKVNFKLKKQPDGRWLIANL